MWFLFMVMQQIIGNTVSQIKLLESFAKSLTTRVRTLNNDLIKLDTSVSAALGLKPDIDRIARAENFIEDGQIDTRRDLLGICSQLSRRVWISCSYGSSIGLLLVFYIWRTIQFVVNPAVRDQHTALVKLIDQVRMLDNDLIRLQEKVDTVLQMKENEILNRNSTTTLSGVVIADEIVIALKSIFSGIGTSAHYLTIENQEKSRKDKIKDDIEAALRAAEREAENTTLAKFIRN